MFEMVIIMLSRLGAVIKMDDICFDIFDIRKVERKVEDLFNSCVILGFLYANFC